MAHLIEIEHDFDEEPFFDAFGNASIRFRLGEDSGLSLAAFMAVVLTCKEPGIYDLRFGIQEVDMSQPDAQYGIDYSIECSKRWVPDGYRELVLVLLLKAIGIVIAHIDAKKVTMQSFYAQLPPEAMVKYDKICELMKAGGFEITKDFIGWNRKVHYWLFNRAR